MLNDDYRKMRRNIINNMDDLTSRSTTKQGLLAWLLYAPIAVGIVLVVLLIKTPLIVFFKMLVQLIKLCILPIICIVAIYDVLVIGWWFTVKERTANETLDR